MMTQDLDQGAVSSLPSVASSSKPLKSILRKSTHSFDADQRRKSWPTLKIQRSVSFSGDRQSRWQESADTLSEPSKCALGLRMPIRKPDDCDSDNDDDDTIGISYVGDHTSSNNSQPRGRRQAPRMPVRRANSDDIIVIEVVMSNHHEKHKQGTNVIESSARQFMRRKVRFINRGMATRGVALSA